MLHITDFMAQHNSSARVIARYGPALLVDDTYHNNIVRAAAQMVGQGKGAWTYHTQFSSGASQWLSPVATGISHLVVLN